MRDELVKVTSQRVSAHGVVDVHVRARGADRVIMELPTGLPDVEDVGKLVSRTAKLDFGERDATTGEWRVAQATGRDGQTKELTGGYFKPNARVVSDQRTNQPQVAFEFSDEGAHLFEQVTRRLVGKPIGIFLDNELISAPTVQTVIRSEGVIPGLRPNEARALAIQHRRRVLGAPARTGRI